MQHLSERHNAPTSYADIDTMRAVEIPLILLAITTVALRLYSRLAVKRKLAIDDGLVLMALIFTFARTLLNVTADDPDSIWGFDRDGPDHPSEVPYYQHIFARRLCYIFAVSLIRCSILSYYLRIFPLPLQSLRRLSWCLLVLTISDFICVLTVLLVFCKDITKLWTKDWDAFTGSRCFSSSAYSYSAAIGDAVLDCLIFALPIPYVWRLTKLRIRQRVGLIVVFALGFAVCVVALMQIPFIKRRIDNSTYFGGDINLLISIQLSLAIVAASLPDIRALIARTWPNFSALHHRSLNTVRAPGGRVEARQRDAEAGNQQESTQDPKVEEGRHAPWRPDWLRDTLPQSLMSTRVTLSELRRGSSNSVMVARAGEEVPPLPRDLERVATLHTLKEVSSPGNSSNG